MKGFDRLHIKDAVKTHKRQNLDCCTLATLDFGQIVPLWQTELVGGDSFNVGPNFFSRMAPLVKPTYGRFSFRQMNVFVPFHQVAYDVDAWFDGKTVWEGTTPYSRYISYLSFVNFLIQDLSTSSTSSNYDFSFTNSSGTLTYMKFSAYGKYVIKVLNALGYSIPQNIDMRTSSNWYAKFSVRTMSALPLLCFAKAYNDYMSQSQRFNSSVLTDLLRCIKYNHSIQSGYNESNHQVSRQGLKIIFDNIKLCYENDYFTSAWQNPNSPLFTSESLASYPVPEGANSSTFTQLVMNTTNDQYLQIDNNSQIAYINQRGLNWLKAFDDWVRRNNYSGSRVVQQIYSRFGVKPDDYKSHYADVISTHIMPVQVGDVTATTTASSQPLGDYAGKGIMNGGKGFEYYAKDRGILMVLGWYTVTPMMPYGSDRAVLKTTPFEYYNPEFDGKAIQAISYGEVFTDPKNLDSSDTSLDDQVYGFTEMYNEYRYGKDRIIGDFRKMDNLDPMNTWHTGRLLTSVRGAGQMVAQSSAMNTLSQYDSEYDRIFSVTSGVDPFYLVCEFNVSAVRPMLSLNQVPDLGEGEVNVPKNGNEIN